MKLRFLRRPGARVRFQRVIVLQFRIEIALRRFKSPGTCFRSVVSELNNNGIAKRLGPSSHDRDSAAL